ncbi:unnamed protein product, partial [Penicillium discolor]
DTDGVCCSPLLRGGDVADAVAAVAGGAAVEQLDRARQRLQPERRVLPGALLLRFGHPSIRRIVPGEGVRTLAAPPEPRRRHDHPPSRAGHRDRTCRGDVRERPRRRRDRVRTHPRHGREAHAAFEELVRAVVPSIGVGVYEAATLGAARALGSAHCLLAHGRRSLRAGVVDEEGLAAFAAGDDRGFTEQEQVVIRFAARLSTAPWAMTDADTQELREAGRWTLVADAAPTRPTVLIGAPHTSNWDFVLMLAIAWRLGIEVHWLGKKSLFRGWRGPIMRGLGGIAVDRADPARIVGEVVEQVHAGTVFGLVVTPDGTRGGNEYWKSGFYRIARATGMPVTLGFVDRHTMTTGLGPTIDLTGDVAADMDRIRAFYADKHGVRPERRTEPRLREETAERPEG